MHLISIHFVHEILFMKFNPKPESVKLDRDGVLIFISMVYSQQHKIGVVRSSGC